MQGPSVTPSFAGTGWTPLCRAVGARHFEVAADLLKHGADPNVSSEDGETPLHRAAALGLQDVAALLLQFRASPNLQDDEGRTPLHVAVAAGDCRLTELLLSHGGNPYATDKYWQTAFDLAPTAGIRGLLEACESDTSLEQTAGERLSEPLGKAELQQGKLYYWLEEGGLQVHFDRLVSAGFGSLDALLSKVRSEVPFTSGSLQSLGLARPADRYKLLIRLEEEAWRKLPRLSCSQSVVPSELSLQEWLELGKLSSVEPQLTQAGYDMETVLLQGQSAHTFTHSMLEHELKLQDKGVRTQFLRHLRQTLNRRPPSGNLCEDCVIL